MGEKGDKKYFSDHGIEGPVIFTHSDLVTVHNRNGAPGSDSVRTFFTTIEGQLESS